MLTIQPKFQKTAFTERFTPEEIQYQREEREYYKTRRELQEQRDSFDDLANDNEIKLPKTAKKLLKGGAVVTTGLLGGMATGWGAKKSLVGLEKLAKTQPMLEAKAYAKSINKFIKDTSKTVKTEFKKSEVYKKPANALNRMWTKFSNSKTYRPIAKFFIDVKNGIKFVYKKVSDGIKYVYDKIRGVKKETWHKATTNIIGTSGGIAAGVEAIKEQNKDAE